MVHTSPSKIIVTVKKPVIKRVHRQPYLVANKLKHFLWIILKNGLHIVYVVYIYKYNIQCIIIIIIHPELNYKV